MKRDASDQAHVRLDRRVIAHRDSESFDRLAFAMRALRIFKPPEMTVAVFEGRLAVCADHGRDYGRGPTATWGMLSVPPWASKAEIALAVASLAGRDQDPYVIDLILAPPTQAA